MEVIINPKFSEVNLSRCNSPEGFNMIEKDILYFSVAIAEECGEFAGVIKKLDRGFNNREHLKMQKEWKNLMQDKPEEIMPTYEEFEFHWVRKMRKKAADELADIFTYVDLTAGRLGLDLNKAVMEKFNKVSEEMKFPEQFKIQ